MASYNFIYCNERKSLPTKISHNIRSVFILYVRIVYEYAFHYLGIMIANDEFRLTF